MKKIVKTDKFIASYIIRIILSCIGSVLLLSIIFSEIILKLDLPSTYYSILSVIIFVLSCFIISFVSVMGFKNNIFVLALISISPLLLMSLFNTVFYSNSFLILLIKTVMGASVCFITALIKTRNKAYKVK